MIKIYDINDKLLMQAEVTSAAKREQEMSKSDYITLSFSAAEKVILPVGAYINYTYKIDKVREVTRKFLLLESYEPTQSDECSWKYTPQFQHPKMILSKTPFFIYTRNSQNVEVKQNVWSFVGTTSALSEKIKDFLNKDLMFGECGWKVIFSNVTANTVNVSFSDNDFISALTAITNAIGDNCEWHIDYDDEIIYIGKVLIGATPVVLEVGKNVGVPSINNSKEGYYNAFSIFGGTRNITQVNSKGENVSSGDIRLQLDEGNGTILIDGKERFYSIDKYSTLDLRADKTKEPLFTKVLDFSQIFPSLNTYVYNVRGRVKYVLDDNNKKIPISYNADGSVKEYKTFTVWYMRLAYPTTEKVEGKTIINTTVDDGVTHYWYDFEVTDNLLIKGKNIGCSFEANFNTGALSTPLAGRGTNGDYVGFELTYHKEASSSHTSDDVSDSNFLVLAGDYEIIYQEDNEVIIPTNAAEMLIPRGESMPSLKCNITVLYNIAMADTIYYEDAQNRLLEKAKEEIVRLLSDLNNYEVKSYSDVFLEDNPQLQIGQSVTYKDGHGYELATRVLKLSTNIDYDFIQSITIGNQVIKGTITQLKEDVQTIIASGGSSGNGGGYSVSQLRKLIAKYGSDNFISKQFDDIANGTITFQKIQKFLQGLLIGNSNNENGGSWTPDAEGRSHLITDYLEVRMKAIFEELVINKTSTIGGKEIISPAGGVVAHKVEEVTVTYNNVSQKAYRCYFLAEQEGDAVDNDFAIGDQVRSESFNVRKGTYHKDGNHFYWRLVIGRDEDPVELEGKKYHYIDLSDTDCATASDVPAKGDVLNQCGNRTDVERQNCLIFSAVDTYSPSISLYHGINSYSFANREYVEYGVNKQNNKAFFNVYGDMYVGDRPTKENGYEGSSYIRYDSSTKQMSVKAKISAKSTVDGKELSQYFKKIGELQNQVDGAIETWFYEGVPTLENAPAISWKTDKDKEIHLGDLYYNNKTGKAYRFAKDSNTYKWTLITDTDIAKALSDARMAQETANGKMKVFSVQPTTPYQVGDIWVNATYPSDGSTYKNEVLRCQTNKAAGSQFAIGDWIKASKYTDDTVANAAKKAAEDAQKAAQTAQTDIKNLGKTVTDNKKEFDNYVTDGYLEPSEIAAMAQDSKRLEDDFAAAQKSYNEVKDAEVLKDTKELTDLNTAFATLTSAKTELIKFLSDISKRYNETDTDGKAAIVSAVGMKFTNFQSAYSEFYDKLGLANAYITSKIYGDLKQNITDLAGYKYLKDALGQTTDIDGGLVMTTLLALRDGDGNVQSGINGAIDPNRGKKSIATWWGGQMVDKDYNSGNLTHATSLIRFDGSGYLANGAIWWDVSGKVHADPTSFIISEKNLGAYLIFFEPTWKEGSAGTSVADLVSLKPNAPFSKLGVSGDATFEGAISFHGIKLTYDATNKAIKIDGNLYATGGITAYGAGASTTGGGGGLNGSVKSYSNALKLTSESLSEIASAYSIKALDSRISSLEGGSAMNVSVSGSGNAVTAINKSGTTIIVTKGTTFLTSHQSLASYLTKTDAASLYQPKGNYLTAHQSLDGYVNEVATSGTGNAITSVSKSGKKLTFTKGATFLTSHQSLANYVTINDSRLSDSRYPKFANCTWYLVGDDAYIGDHNLSGYFCVKSANSSTRVGISLWNRAENDYANLWFDNTNINLDKQLVMNNKRIWIQGVGTAGGNNNRLTLVAGMPSGLAYNTSCRGTILYSNGIAFADPYNGNSNNDSGWIRHLETSASSGTLEIAVGDDASNEQIHFRWYNINSSAETIAHDITVPRATGTLALISQIPTSLPANGGNADKLDGYHANGLLTALSNSDKGISITVGGTTKSISNISVNYAGSAGNADTVDGYHATSGRTFDGNINWSSNWNDSWSDGTNKHPWYGFDHRYPNTGAYSTTITDYFGMTIKTHNTLRLDYGKLLLNGTSIYDINVASASKLATARSIWGQSFDGTGNVNGTIYINNSDSENGAIILNNNVNANARISAIKDQVVFNTGAAIRFGATNWKYSDWAGLKYDTVANAIYLGIADGTVFNYYSNKRSDGTLKFPGITTITPDAAARIGGSGGDLYLGNGNNTNWVKVQDMCSQVDSNNWKIMQGGYALFKDITIINTATINGSTHINNLLTAKGIMPTTADVNAFGTRVQNWDGSIGANVTNMFNGIPQGNIQVEYSMDNGASWNTYPGNAESRFNLVNDNTGVVNYYLGYNNLLGDTKADKLAQIKKNQLRVTVKIPDEISQELSWISVDVNNGVDIKCQVYFGSSTGGYKEYVSKILKGWAHKCDICVGPLNVNVGNDTYRYVRLVFSHLNTHTDLRNGIVAKIRALALTKYSYANDRYTISTTGHIYDYDPYMNTYFPNSILAKGGVTAYQSSDIRLKQDLRKLDYLGIIKAMGGTFSFAWKKDNTRSIGWIAQHVLCNPHLKDIVETDEKGYYKINYWSPKLIATAFGAIEQVGDEVSRLKARVVFLESEVQRLSGDKEDCKKKRLDNKNINSLN